MAEVHCAYRYKGEACPHPPDDGRLVDLGNGDSLEVLLCHQHNLTVGALWWADKQRGDMRGRL